MPKFLLLLEVGNWNHSEFRRFGQRCKKNFVLVAGHFSNLCAFSQLLVAVVISMHHTVDGCYPENGKATRPSLWTEKSEENFFLISVIFIKT